MTASQTLNLYNLTLRYFKNEADAKAFVSEVESVVDDKFENKKNELSSKADISTLKDEINRLDIRIADTKAELIKSIYLVGLIQFLAIVGSVVGILSVMLRK